MTVPLLGTGDKAVTRTDKKTALIKVTFYLLRVKNINRGE